MFKAKDLKDFEKMVKKAGYKITTTTKHHKIVDGDGNALMVFAIKHNKGGKKEVKAYYVQEFTRLSQQGE